MSTALLGLVVLAGLACPAHMLWSMRRGRRASCMPAAPEEASVEALAERQRALGRKIAATETARGAEDERRAGYPVRS